MNDFNSNSTSEILGLSEPRFESSEPMLMAGLRELLHMNSSATIPLLWQRLMKIEKNIAHKVDDNFYGLCIQADQDCHSFYYLAGCEVSDLAGIAAALSPMIIPSHTYAVFEHPGHVAVIKETIYAIFDEWLPDSNYRLVEQDMHSIHHIEKYSPAFNPTTGVGGMEIWVPVVKKE